MQREISIRLIPDGDLVSIVPLLQVLNPAIPEGILLDRLTEMVSPGVEVRRGLFRREAHRHLRDVDSHQILRGTASRSGQCGRGGRMPVDEGGCGVFWLLCMTMPGLRVSRERAELQP